MIEALRHSSAHVFVESVEAPTLSSEDQHHLERVLRLRDGETVTCSDGKGAWRTCRWSNSALVVDGEVHHAVSPSPQLTVGVVPIKGDRTDLVVEKLVEIGVDRIAILGAVERSVVRWTGDKETKVIERYQRIIRAAAMQSRRVFLPELIGPVALSDALANGAAIAEPGGSASLDDVTYLVVGPEGGFSAAEVALARQTMDLGPAILRAETAAMVGAARMVAHWRR